MSPLGDAPLWSQPPIFRGSKKLCANCAMSSVPFDVPCPSNRLGPCLKANLTTFPFCEKIAMDRIPAKSCRIVCTFAPFCTSIWASARSTPRQPMQASSGVLPKRSAFETSALSSTSILASCRCPASKAASSGVVPSRSAFEILMLAPFFTSIVASARCPAAQAASSGVAPVRSSGSRLARALTSTAIIASSPRSTAA